MEVGVMEQSNMALFYLLIYRSRIELRSIYLNVNVVDMQQKRKQNDKKLQKYSIVSK